MTQKVEIERMLEICGQLMYSASDVVAAVNKYKTECDTLKTEIEHLKADNSELMKELKESAFKLVDIKMKQWLESGEWKNEIDQEKSKYVLDKLYRCTNKYDGSIIIGKAWYKEDSPCKGWNFDAGNIGFNEHHCEKIEPYDGVDTKKCDEVSDSYAEETRDWFDKLQEREARIADLEDRIDRYKKRCELLTTEISTKNDRIAELEKDLRKWKEWCLEWKVQCLELKYPCEEKECGESTSETTEEKEDVMKPLNDKGKELLELRQEEKQELKDNIKLLRVERYKMANAVSGEVWKELMARAKNIDGPVNTTMAGFGFNDISDIVLNKIIDYETDAFKEAYVDRDIGETLEIKEDL